MQAGNESKKRSGQFNQELNNNGSFENVIRVSAKTTIVKQEGKDSKK